MKVRDRVELVIDLISDWRGQGLRVRRGARGVVVAVYKTNALMPEPSVEVDFGRCLATVECRALRPVKSERRRCS